MSLQAEMRLALDGGDIDRMWELWAHVFPHLPAIATRAEAEYVFHGARVMSESCPFKHRAWSHHWLTERGLPSHLPDHLKPKAERLYPKEFAVVGVAVKTASSRNPTLREFGQAVQGAMGDKAWEMMDDGVINPDRIKAEMMHSREKVHRQW